MHRRRVVSLGLALAVSSLLSALPAAAQHDHAASKAATSPSAAALARLQALAGEWIDVDGSTGQKDKVVVVYHVTGAGSAVVETLFPGTPHEMTTVYHTDGDDLVLTHYCAAGNQPRMRARKPSGDKLVFEFDGGTNLDPAKDMHMHSGFVALLGPDRVDAEWQAWVNGSPDGAHVAKFHLARKKG
ncbi:MAG: hypothetical protein IPJ17_03365 [Holophagales bacterium]|nr:MAG: hypothetical protein IPJ17_03365 [Holophagales bacterium]